MNIRHPRLDRDDPPTHLDGVYSPFSLYALIFDKLPRILGKVTSPLSFFALLVLVTAPIIVIAVLNGDYRAYIGSFLLLYFSCFVVARLSMGRPGHLNSDDPTQAAPDQGNSVTSYVAKAVTVTLQARRDFSKSFGRLLQDSFPHRVDLSGLSLLATVTGHWGCFLKLAESGCKFRFLLVAPDSPTLETIMAGIEDIEQPPVNIAADVWQSLKRLSLLISTGNVKVRFSSFAPTCSILNIESDYSQDMVQVELYGIGISPSERPHFILHPEDSPWFERYKEQFERLWHEARPLDQTDMPSSEMEVNQDDNA